MTEEEYDLDKSAKKIGKLYPILKDKTGNIIDGFHRQNIDPDWPSIKVDSIDTPQKLELARLSVNYCRRTIKSGEFANRLAFLVGKCKMKPEEIAEETGIDISTIYRHIPPNLKPASEKISEGLKRKYEIARQEVATATPSLKTSDIPIRPNGLVECEIGMHLVDPSKAKNINGHIVCDAHIPIIKTRFAPKSQIETKEYKPAETWEYRKAVMSPQHSKMEEQVLTKLLENNIHGIIQNREFNLLSTTPDLYFPKQNIAIYLDGKEVHANRTDRDEKFREMLEHKGVKVYSITYDSTSNKETDRIVNQILSFIS